MMLPLLLASVMLTATTPVQALVVAGPNTAAALLLADPAVGAEKVTATLLYPLPLSSVPAVLAVGAVVYSAAYTVAGLVYVVFLSVALAI